MKRTRGSARAKKRSNRKDEKKPGNEPPKRDGRPNRAATIIRRRFVRRLCANAARPRAMNIRPASARSGGSKPRCRSAASSSAAEKPARGRPSHSYTASRSATARRQQRRAAELADTASSRGRALSSQSVPPLVRLLADREQLLVHRLKCPQQSFQRQEVGARDLIEQAREPLR